MNTWTGDPPEVCDLCGTKIEDAFVDGKIKECTAWGIMCPFCALIEGIGLGEGKGQLYAKSASFDGFVKIKG